MNKDLAKISDEDGKNYQDHMQLIKQMEEQMKTTVVKKKNIGYSVQPPESGYSDEKVPIAVAEVKQSPAINQKTITIEDEVVSEQQDDEDDDDDGYSEDGFVQDTLNSSPQTKQKIVSPSASLPASIMKSIPS